MKKAFASLILFGSSFFASAQNISNGSFENWQSFTNYNVPDSFRTKDQVLFSGNPCVTKSFESHSGQFAAAIQTMYLSIGVGMSGQLNYGSLVNNNGVLSFFGWPFLDQPNALHFWYKYLRNGNDTARVNITLTHWNGYRETVGTGSMVIVANASSYTPADISINYTSGTNPDSIDISFISSSNLVPTPGTTLYIDDVRFDLADNIKPTSTVSTSIFPNPSLGIWNLSFTSLASHSIIVLNTQGLRVKEFQSSDNSFLLDLSDCPAGLYCVLIQNDNKKEIYNIIHN